jgi:membrane-associated phospholipid phosphatase
VFKKTTIMKKLLSPKLLFYSALFILLAEGCRKQDQLASPQEALQVKSKTQSLPDEQLGAQRFDSYVAQTWYSLMLRLIVETPGHTPPVAARSFGYAGVALYESILSETPQHHSLAGQLNGLSSLPQRKFGNSYAAPLTANAALARIVKDLFQNTSADNLNRIDLLESANEKLYSGQISQQIINRSRDYGRSVADAVFNWSLTDGGDQAYLRNFPDDYVPPVGIDKWIPTPPLFQSALLPWWGNNRTMVSANNAGPVDPPIPPSFSASPGSSFYDAAYEVYNTGINLSPEQNTIALYWNDGAGSFFPPGHNVAIALQMIRNRNLNLNQAAALLAKVGIALNDAAIVCWRAKYIWNLLRPETFILTYIDASWATLIPTPPFPTYTSGHSTFSGAAAAILTAELGNQIPFTDSSKIAAGFLPRSFSNFNEYAQEAAISRLYGGIHYSFDNKNGFECGKHVADNVEQINW